MHRVTQFQETSLAKCVDGSLREGPQGTRTNARSLQPKFRLFHAAGWVGRFPSARQAQVYPPHLLFSLSLKYPLVHMALLLLLPNEILWSIMRYLKPHAGISLLRSCRTLHELTKDEKFWREYARYHCITYRDPTRLWYTLYATGDLFKMCSHIDYLQLLESLPRKRQVFWQLLADFRNRLSCCCSRARLDGESALCMAPDCDFVGKCCDVLIFVCNDLHGNLSIGCGEATFSFDDSNLGHMKEHWEKTNHSITLKLSPFNFLEMWCYACRMPVSLHQRNKCYHSYMCLTSVGNNMFNCTVAWFLGFSKHDQIQR